MSEKVVIELKAKVHKKIYYNHDSSFGVFAMIPITNKKSVELNEWGNFKVTGNIQELFEGNEYDIVITPTTHPKYGDGYQFIRVEQDLRELSNPEKQKAFLKTLVTEKQYQAIIERYPNEPIIDLIRNDEFDYNSVKGLGEVTYNRIKKKIIENLDIQEALVELKELNISYTAIKNLINHFGSAKILIKKVKEDIYSLLEVKGFGFLKVDAYALNRGDSKENPSRILSGLIYILEQEENQGHSWISKNKLIEKATKLLQVNSKLIEKILEQEINKKHTKIYLENNKVALKYNFYYENEIKKKLNLMLNTESNIKVNDIDDKISKLEEEKKITFTDEQKEAIKLAVENNVFILNGKAGSGKTTTLIGIINVLKDYTYCCCALSGKASKIMSSLGLNAMTIHRMLRYSSETGRFEYNESERLPYDIIIIDEAGMCSNYLMYSVISAVRDDAKIIIIGDSGQLAPIGCGAVFDDLLKSKKIPMKELTKIHRQAQKSGILSTANKIRDGIQIINKDDYERKVIGELNDLVIYPVQNRECIKDLILDICNNYLINKDLRDFQIITGLKERGDISTKNLNIELQKIFNDIDKPCIKRMGYEYREGDKIIQSGNNYNAGQNGEISIFNGTMGIIQSIELGSTNNDHRINIKFDDIDEIITYTYNEMDQIELAYAISCHKSQGSTIPYILFAFDYASYMLLSRQFVYTGLTRASKGCIMICENDALRHAIRTDHSGNRRTFLYDLLVN